MLGAAQCLTAHYLSAGADQGNLWSPITLCPSHVDIDDCVWLIKIFIESSVVKQQLQIQCRAYVLSTGARLRVKKKGTLKADGRMHVCALCWPGIRATNIALYLTCDWDKSIWSLLGRNNSQKRICSTLIWQAFYKVLRKQPHCDQIVNTIFPHHFQRLFSSRVILGLTIHEHSVPQICNLDHS